MATTSTFKQLLEELTERSRFGDVLGTVTGVTTGWTASTSYVKGPFSNQKWPRGSPILTTAGTALNEASYIDQYTASTGAATVEPDFTSTWTDGIVWPYGQGVFHADDVKDCINRSLTLNCTRLEPRPLTYVPDGDMQGTTVTDYWTAAANGVAAYANAQVYPATGAVDAVGQVGLNRVVQLTSTGATSVAGNGIRTVVSTRGQPWYFQSAIRLVSGSGTVEFKVRDNTNSADITLQVMRGNDTSTLTTTTLGDFMIVEGTFTLPATCAEIAPQLSLSATTMVAQMGPVIMFPLDANTFPLPNRITRDGQVGNFYFGKSSSGPSSIGSLMLSTPITNGGATHTIRDYGDHRSVTFNFRPWKSVWYDEWVRGASLSAMTDTTTFEKEYVVKWALVYLYELLARHDKEKWAANLDSAKRAVGMYERQNLPEVTLVGRR